MDFELSEDLITLRDTVRKFAEEVVRPNAREWDANSEIPTDVYRQLGELGLLGMVTPEALGGADLGYLGASVCIEEVARQCGGTALAICAHNGLGLGHILVAGNDEQKKKYVPKLASGEFIGAWGLTEPHCGSDAAALQTTAVKDGNAYVINGSKMFITNAGIADTIVVIAITDPEGKKGSNASAFIVEKDTPGLILGAKEDKLGVRASNTVALTFEDMRVPAENLCGTPGRGYKDALAVLERGRITIAALSVGLARGSLEEALAYAQGRDAFGGPIANLQAVQFMLADMAMNTDAARLLVRKAAMIQDSGASSKIDACIAKLYASEIATKAALDAIQICGGYGYLKDMPVERYLRDAKLMEIGEGTSQIQRLVIARSILEEAAA